MAGEGARQLGVLEKLLKGAPLAIMATQLAAVWAEGQESGEAAQLLLSAAVGNQEAGGNRGEKQEEESVERGGGERLPGVEKGSEQAGKESCWSAEVVEGEPNREEKDQEDAIAGERINDPRDRREGEGDAGCGTPAAEELGGHRLKRRLTNCCEPRLCLICAMSANRC